MVTLVTGGAASGKSEYAEELCLRQNSGQLIYIATMMPYGDESLEKIKKHKLMRKEKEFKTIECLYDLQSINVEKNSTVIVECISNLLANEMYCENRNKEKAVSEIIEGINKLKKDAENVVIVTNEIFSDGNNYDYDTKKYIENLGLINEKLAELSDNVVEIVYGIEVKIK